MADARVGRWGLIAGSVGVAVWMVGMTTPAGASGDPSSDIDEIRVTSAYTPERGEFEIYQVTEFLNDGGPKSTKIFTRLEYGLTDDLVLEAKVPFKFKRPKTGDNTEGVGDVVLEARHRVLREPEAPVAMAVGFEVGFPTGDEERGLGNGNFKYEPILSFGKQFGTVWLHQDAKLEFIRNTGGNGSEVEGSATTALTWTPVEEWMDIEHPTLELALDWKWVEQKKTKVALIPAFRGELKGLPVEVEWGLGVPIGLTDAADDWGVISVFEIEF